MVPIPADYSFNTRGDYTPILAVRSTASATRLRANRQLTDIRAADLECTAEDSSIFLNQVMESALSPDDVHSLQTKTAVWIAGLQLEALSLAGREDRSGFIAEMDLLSGAGTGQQSYP